MIIALILLLISVIYLIAIILVAMGLFKDPVLRQFERYYDGDDAFHLLPATLLGLGLVAIFGGWLFSATVAPQYPPLFLGLLLIFAAYFAFNHRRWMSQYPQVFMAFPRWYAELRERTTREERRRIAYMWLCLPPRMRMHLNGSDRHFLVWADQVILATVTQTVEDQEARITDSRYIPDLYGRYG